MYSMAENGIEIISNPTNVAFVFILGAILLFISFAMKEKPPFTFRASIKWKSLHNEELGLGEYDTHEIYFNTRGTEESSEYLTILCKWLAEHGLGKLPRRQTLLRAIIQDVVES